MNNEHDVFTDMNTPIQYSENIQIRIVGNSMNRVQGYELHEILATLSSFESASKKVYLSLVGRDKFLPKDREDFSVKLMEINEGSFLSELQVVYSSIIVPLVPVVIDNKEIIWNTIKTSFDFLKEKLTAKKEGKDVQINQTASENGNNMAIINNQGHITINVHPGIPEQAQKLVPEFEKITKLIDGNNVNKIELINTEEDTNRIDIFEKDKELFSQKTFTEDKIFAMSGKVVDGAFSKLTGKIQVTSADTDLIEVGHTYNFVVSENLRAEESWKEMFLEERPYYCKKRIKYDPSSENVISIKEIIIVDWDEKRWVS